MLIEKKEVDPANSEMHYTWNYCAHSKDKEFTIYKRLTKRTCIQKWKRSKMAWKKMSRQPKFVLITTEKIDYNFNLIRK